MRRTSPLGGVRDGSAGARDPEKAGVATSASLNGMRRGEKAEVLENAQPDTQGSTRGLPSFLRFVNFECL